MTKPPPSVELAACPPLPLHAVGWCGAQTLGSVKEGKGEKEGEKEGEEDEEQEGEQEGE